MAFVHTVVMSQEELRAEYDAERLAKVRAENATREALAASMAGHRIVKAQWTSTEDNWPQGEEVFTVWLDDGRVIRIDGWGYDAYGTTIEDVTAAHDDGKADG
jgi:hypothetical protein